MNVLRRNFLLFASLAAAAAASTAALPQTRMPAVGPAGKVERSAAVVPDFSGLWRHPSLPGFEPPASGPGPVTNRSRTRTGTSNWNELVGDHGNPILKPWAAEIVKKHGEISKAGLTYPTPSSQCWPQPVPYIFWTFITQVVQTPDKITFLYADPGILFRQVRLNQPHAAPVTPSWDGDSVGHFEGDTLVIDTVGIKTERPYAMVDWFGTPYTGALHVVERYRLLDYADAKDALERDTKENVHVMLNSIDRNYRGKHLQLEFTVEDEGTFTTPWTATITYLPSLISWEEWVCAENIHEYHNHRDADVPRADKPDF
jgi:hypothetical protein